MASYLKFSELTGSSQTALITAVHPAGVSNTSVVTQEYIFDEDAELDYSASFTDGMAAGTVTFTELPATTKAVWIYYKFSDTGVHSQLLIKRSSGGTAVISIAGQFADAGTNAIDGTAWLPTDGNTIYVTGLAADTTSTFVIIGYKTGQ